MRRFLSVVVALGGAAVVAISLIGWTDRRWSGSRSLVVFAVGALMVGIACRIAGPPDPNAGESIFPHWEPP